MYHSVLKQLVLMLALVCYLASCAPVDRSLSSIESREPFRASVHGFVQGAKQKMRTFKKFAPPINKAVFWSGKVDHPKIKGGRVSVSPHAQQYAKNHGGQTINMALKRIGTRIEPHRVNRLSPKIWDAASRVFARKAKGVVHAILGKYQNSKSVWNRIEKPTLLRNPKVHTVIGINAATKVRHYIKGGKK